MLAEAERPSLKKEASLQIKAEKASSDSRAVLGAWSATRVVVTYSAVPFELYALGCGDYGGVVLCGLVVAATGAGTGAAASEAAKKDTNLRNSMP